MAFKSITFFALLAAANAGYISSPVTYTTAPVAKYVNPSVDAVAATQHNVVRSFDGTVTQYSKSVHTPYSSVHKEDTRINNNVYTPAIAKTVTYAAPAVTKTILAPTYYTHDTPAVTKTVYSHESPIVYSQPSVAKTVYSNESPVVYSHPTVAKTLTYVAPTATTTTYNHGPAATTYNHNAPGVSGYGSSQTIHYSPANMVSHMSFDGFGTHWGF